jgi:hypothetical protein
VELVHAASAQQAVPGQSLGLTLEWRALAPTEDLTLFVQLLNPQGQLAAQFDGPPVANYPATSAWPRGARLVERVNLNLPKHLAAGPYQLHLGLYRLPEVQRLENGLPDNTLVLGKINVQP